MPSFGEEDDRDGPGTPNGSSDNEPDEAMEDVDDVDIDGDADADGDGEGDDDDNDNDEDEEGQDQDDNQDPFLDSPSQLQLQSRMQGRPLAKTHSPVPVEGSTSSTGSADLSVSLHRPPTSQPHPTVLPTTPSPPRASDTHAPAIIRPTVRSEALTAPVYDIVPTIAAPHSTSINAVTTTPDMRWVFSGGTDGYIRKFNWIDTVNGKVMLTVAQRHPFVDSVTKAGVLISYWENEEPQSKSLAMQAADDGPSLSPVYSLAVQNHGLWLLSGLESGGINLQSVRHDEGKRITCLRKHTSAVSVLLLSQDEKSVLSGSWDKTVLDWDLNTGQSKRSFEGSGGQISAIESRPVSSLPVPPESNESILTNGTMSSNNGNKPLSNGYGSNGDVDTTRQETQADGGEEAPSSPADSLFGGNDADSLFGDKDESRAGAPSGGEFADDEDDEFSRAIANGLQQQEAEDAEGDVDMSDAGGPVQPPDPSAQLLHQAQAEDLPETGVELNGTTATAPMNGLPHAEEAFDEARSQGNEAPAGHDLGATSDTTFFAASMDGTIRIWDRRKSTPLARILPRNVPPWCMNACWSPDGNFIYAGRRNGTVEEFSLHKGFRCAERTFKFPRGSGPVSAVRAMPNGRHLMCASFDILRLYDLKEQLSFKHSTVPFLIVPGHRTGVVSQLYIDPTCKYMISTAGNRGWEGTSTEVLLGYEIGVGG